MGAAGTRQTQSLPPCLAAPHRSKALRANRAVMPPIMCVLHTWVVKGSRGRCAVEKQVNIRQSKETICAPTAQRVPSHQLPGQMLTCSTHSIAGISCPFTSLMSMSNGFPSGKGRAGWLLGRWRLVKHQNNSKDLLVCSPKISPSGLKFNFCRLGYHSTPASTEQSGTLINRGDISAKGCIFKDALTVCWTHLPRN